MKRSDFMLSLRGTQGLLNDLELLQIPRWFAALEPSDEFTALAHRRDTRYADLFRTGLRNSDYNFLLTDFSYLQFYHIEGKETFEVRYAFYPNPFDVIPYEEFCRSLEVVDSDAADVDPYEVYYEHLAGVEEHLRTPPVRYEVSFRQYEELVHPAAHLHVGLHAESRWPVDRILTPLTFAAFVAKLFYAANWHVGRPKGAEGRNRFDEVYIREKRACATIETAHFSDAERGQLFVG
jgi:hypothetical protein